MAQNIVTIISSLLLLSILTFASQSNASNTPTSPTPWPAQFHSELYVNLTSTGKLQIDDLYYDWTNGRNLNRLQSQLGSVLYDVEWDNGTSYYYTKGEGATCQVRKFPVGVLRPDWLSGAEYLGRAWTGGFECYLWTKVEFIWYYEEVETGRPVRWDFFDGMTMHVMTWEVGVVLEDSEWQAPEYCFTDDENNNENLQGLEGKIENLSNRINVFDYLHFRKFASM
ncbi:hypothetical protein LUZ60_002019 [Juncus effusus]|nr:hypothetical protein LUZ60_002019 [Juncus effusus]